MSALVAGLLTGFGLIVAIGAQNVFVLRQGLAKRSSAFTLGAVMASAIWFFGLALAASAMAPLFRRRLARRGIDLFVALVMFGVAFFLVRGLFNG